MGFVSDSLEQKEHRRSWINHNGLILMQKIYFFLCESFVVPCAFFRQGNEIDGSDAELFEAAMINWNRLAGSAGRISRASPAMIFPWPSAMELEGCVRSIGNAVNRSQRPRKGKPGFRQTEGRQAD